MERLPTKLWSCEAPGRPGKTIGSSGARWLKPQALTKFTPWSAPTLFARSPPVPARATPRHERDERNGDEQDRAAHRAEYPPVNVRRA